MHFTEASVLDQAGKTFVITGGNSGIGFEAARILGGKGARVLLACRSPERAKAAVERLVQLAPRGSFETVELDLASLASVRRAVENLTSRAEPIHGLANNAGLMALPYTKTADGFEMQLGTNHLGHFALTAGLFAKLAATPKARIVNVASQAHRLGRIHFDDLMGERGYEKWQWYGQSKLANLLFTFELARRVRRASVDVIVAAAHPGYSATELQGKGAAMEGKRVAGWTMSLGNGLLAQSAAMGALPTVRALTDPEVSGGNYYGPKGFFELWGSPVRVQANARANDELAARRLWDESERLTGARFEGLGG